MKLDLRDEIKNVLTPDFLDAYFTHLGYEYKEVNERYITYRKTENDLASDVDVPQSSEYSDLDFLYADMITTTAKVQKCSPFWMLYRIFEYIHSLDGKESTSKEILDDMADYIQ